MQVVRTVQRDARPPTPRTRNASATADAPSRVPPSTTSAYQVPRVRGRLVVVEVLERGRAGDEDVVPRCERVLPGGVEDGAEDTAPDVRHSDPQREVDVRRVVHDVERRGHRPAALIGRALGLEVVPARSSPLPRRDVSVEDGSAETAERERVVGARARRRQERNGDQCKAREPHTRTVTPRKPCY